MPLWMIVFIPLSAAAVILLVYVTGGGGIPARFDSLGEARARILRDVPTWTLGHGVLALDGVAALFVCPDRQRIAVARAHGIGFFTRFIGTDALRGYDLGDEGTLHLFIDDFTSPVISMVLPPSEVPAWRAHLDALGASADPE